MKAAYILDRINQDRPEGNNTSLGNKSRRLINPNAVAMDMQNINKAHESILKENMMTRRRGRLHRKITAFMELNSHTLVQHSVGYHVDHFDKGEPTLENKVCYSLSGLKGVGRGGDGEKFVFAILDW